jgi:hypothetical protein
VSERVLGEPASIEQLGALADVVRALDADGIEPDPLSLVSLLRMKEHDRGAQYKSKDAQTSSC